MNKLAWVPVVSGAFVLVMSVMVTVWTVTRPQSMSQFSAQAKIEQITVSIFPQKASLPLTSKEGLPVGVLFESGEKTVDKVDVVISFDPKIAQGSLLTRGMAFETYTTTNIDNVNGIIRIVANNSQPKVVNGILASFKVKALKAGTVTLNIRQAVGAEKSVGAAYTAQ